MTTRSETYPVIVGNVQIGGDAPVRVQAMTNTNTTDVAATVAQVNALADVGAELVRFTVNTPEAAQAVPEIAARLRDMGCDAPLIGDFHYNGHTLLRDFPKCAKALDKYRINPGNVGRGAARDERFSAIVAIARDHGKAVRIGVNAGSLDQELVQAKLAENARLDAPVAAETVLNECMIISALDATEQAIALGLPETRIVLSCKSSRPKDLIALYRELARRTRHPLHLGLTEAGMGVKGLVWSAAAMSVLLEGGIGDTIRVSLTPEPGGDRREEVYAGQELLQALGLRQFSPSVTACPGCGRTSGAAFQRLAAETQRFLRERLPEWRKQYPGVETLTVAVMGCVVNGPGESKAANIGINLPGDNEKPSCPVYADGGKIATLQGTEDMIAASFEELIEAYVARRYATEEP
ncbi:MAG TPA: flavodoxin-dependent (E)-4-hydroxy-3-methylbut-2-enyl-diphosphate synthase [Candidatus Hydrogenedentes bacterium]|nr:flavodoxin-dependent (E)-4-hydroxy-3-methylbut-2-enyl-diphosphate synthase [Candidatus Hydrogenedentota bacterium]